jgi:hypothetical protein
MLCLHNALKIARSRLHNAQTIVPSRSHGFSKTKKPFEAIATPEGHLECKNPQEFACSGESVFIR